MRQIDRAYLSVIEGARTAEDVASDLGITKTTASACLSVLYKEELIVRTKRVIRSKRTDTGGRTGHAFYCYELPVYGGISAPSNASN